jgi:hypothetical protein
MHAESPPPIPGWVLGLAILFGKTKTATLSTVIEADIPEHLDRNEPLPTEARLVHATITETMDTHGHLFPDVEDLGQGAIDAISAVALTEQGRNQDAN